MSIVTPLALTIALLIISCKESGTASQSTGTAQVISMATGDTVKQLGKNIMVIYQDKNNNYWFGSWEDGLYRYDGKTILHFSNNRGLSSNRIEEIKEDHQGNVYVNTDAGLFRFDGKQFTAISEVPGTLSIWGLQPNDLWFKSPKRGHVYRFDGKSLMNLAIPKCKIGDDYLAKNPSAIDPYGIYSLYQDAKGNIWFGFSLLGTMRYNGQSFDWISEPDVTELHDGPANGVRSIIEDRDGYFWFNASYRYRVFDSASSKHPLFYDRLKSIGNLDGRKDSNLNEYLSIAKDNNNHLWMATYRHGVWKYDGEKVIHYPILENGENIPLFFVYKDKSGKIWLGTHENGVYRFNGKAFEKFKP